MSSFKCLCLVVLLVPFTLSTVGCGGETDSGPMATDDQLQEYGANAAKGTALENFRSGGEAKAE